MNKQVGADARGIRVLLADDHTLVRSGIRKLIETLPQVEVVGEAGDGAGVVSMARETLANLVLMDIAMPGLNGLDATRQVVRELPGVRVIILSMYTDEEYVAQALRAGARGYLLKDAATAELELALSAVARGDTFLSPAISRQVIGEYLRRVNDQDGPPDLLTPRQREVLQLLAEGHPTKQIAYRLGVSVKTVETHRSQIMDRLGIRELAGLVRYAVRHGLVSPQA